MQELSRLWEFFAHFGQNTLGKTPPPSPPGLGDLEGLGLRLAEPPLPPFPRFGNFVCGD